ncbi:hypothetical protein Ddye_006528 [Dipteronia dyeriana]|uniref:MULE transposase domain-containing protein n=1 Tax=Dipteronia dyeriana TaxID=168575 RepID=A0AAE0CQM1_9ROSI|nr:hypothetical protein Ddye_006528 [Dipteronia dyeriana]
MQIRAYKNEHLCHRLCRSEEARAKWIASKFGTLVKNNPDIKSEGTSSVGKEHEASFKHLRKYAIMVQQCNPGSVAYLYLLEPTTTFQRFFPRFEAQKNGFIEGCRLFIGIDGCHLKGLSGEVLLSAIALDANNGIFFNAFCIREGEIVASWS